MASLVGSADIYITPYRYEAQAVSGTLAYAMGKGKAIISTPYWYATEVLADGRGALVPFDDSAAVADTVTELLDNESALQAMRKRAYLYARDMVWDQIAQSYMQTFVRSCANRMNPHAWLCTSRLPRKMQANGSMCKRFASSELRVIFTA